MHVLVLACPRVEGQLLLLLTVTLVSSPALSRSPPLSLLPPLRLTSRSSQCRTCAADLSTLPSPAAEQPPPLARLLGSDRHG
eukprot:763708-Hanusia_phi.AAC.3